MVGKGWESPGLRKRSSVPQNVFPVLLMTVLVQALCLEWTDCCIVGAISLAQRLLEDQELLWCDDSTLV